MFWKRIAVRETERALIFLRGRLEEVLEPGVYWKWVLDREVELFGTLDPVVDSGNREALLRSGDALVERYFVRVRVGEGEAAVVLADDVLIRVLGPGEGELYWRTPKAIAVRRFNIVAEPAVDAELVPAILRYGAPSRASIW